MTYVLTLDCSSLSALEPLCLEENKDAKLSAWSKVHE